MENIFRLVSESFARHSFDGQTKSEGAPLSEVAKSGNENPRPEWSRWFRCESSFSVLLAPAKPGVFALGEETVPAGDGSKRMLALFHLAEADDLGMALGRLFLPGNPLLRTLQSGRCFARYAVIEDATQRSAACETLRRWMQDSAETASGISSGEGAPYQPSTSSAWGVRSMEAQTNREAQDVSRRPQPLPAGF